jgi:uncharacterized protein YndB with AHSA1/START domain
MEKTMTRLTRPEHRGRTIETTIRTTATPEQIFEAWADPGKLAQWFPDRAEGRAVEGGVQKWFFDRFNYALPYEVATAVPGEQLVYTGVIPGRPRFYLEIDIVREAGATAVTLINSGFLDKDGWDEEYEGIASGWQMAMALLKLYAERHYGRDRRQFFTMRPASYEYPDLMPLYTTPELLASWLTTSGAIGSADQPCALVLRNGDRVTGEVLARSGWEVQLSWDEIEGALALKGFGIGSGRRAVSILGSGWGLSAERAASLEAFFAEALERLAATLEAGPIPRGERSPDRSGSPAEPAHNSPGGR